MKGIFHKPLQFVQYIVNPKGNITKTFIWLLFCVFAAHSYAQEEDLKDLFVEAESYFLFEEYNDALPIYQKIYRIQPNNYNVCYKIGICYLNDIYRKEKSIPYFQKASLHIDTKYNVNSHKELSAPPEVLFYLGIAFRKTGNLHKAIATFHKFKNYAVANTDLFNTELINEEIQACQYALKLKEEKFAIEKHNNLGGINSSYAETNPIISANGKVMVFVRKLPFYEGVFLSKKTGDSWAEPINLTEYFGVDGNSYCTGLSGEGDELFIYRSDQYDGNIYVSKATGGEWSKLKKLGKNINTKYWESHASPSADGKYLYFTSNRKGGFGGLDIYMAKRNRDDSWGEAVNLGPVINSEYDEETPFLTASGKKLYFASMGHKSSGGFDIYVSNKIDKDAWSVPQNMGYPFNTPDDELFYCPAPNEDWGYFSLFEPTETNGLTDIFYVSVFKPTTPISSTITQNLSEYQELKSIKHTIRGTLKPGGTNADFTDINAQLIDNSGQIIDRDTLTGTGNYEVQGPFGKYNLQFTGNQIETINMPVEILAADKATVINMQDIDANSKTDAIVVSENMDYVVEENPTDFDITDNEFFTDNGEVIKIPLKAKKGSIFKVKTYIGDSLYSDTYYRASQKNPEYFFEPKPGNNKVVFSLLDENEKTIGTKIVNVQYTLPITQATIAEGSAPITNEAGEIIIHQKHIDRLLALSSNDLKQFLASNNIADSLSLSDFYHYLVKNASSNNFKKTDVDILMALWLTQKEIDNFTNQLTYKNPFLNNLDTLSQNLPDPIVLIQEIRGQNNIEENIKFENELFKIVNNGFDSLQLAQKYIKSFRKYAGNIIQVKRVGGNSIPEQITQPNINEYLPIDLAASTKSFVPFYSHLLFNAKGKTKEYISTINFDSLRIRNAIDLTKHLIEGAGQNGISTSDLLNLIQQSNLNEGKNIQLFIDILTENAVGNIKVNLTEMQKSASKYNSYTEVIYQLSTNAQNKGYTREELYRFLLDLANIYTPAEIVDYLKKTNKREMLAALSDVNLQQFSNAYELVQYLLANASHYAYTEWDICSILSQLLLEKGFKDYLIDDKYRKPEPLLSDTLTQIILLSGLGLSLLLILLIVMRNKKKNN